MNQELQDQLFDKYSEIFAQRHLPMTQTCMCWGIDTGDGWYQIIDDLCAKIKAYVNEQRVKYPKFTVEAIQVKEKFGVLRFYIDYGDDYIYNLITEATEKSRKTCDVCGEPGNLATYNHWWMTLCKTHSDEYIAKTGRNINEIHPTEDEDDDEDS